MTKKLVIVAAMMTFCGGAMAQDEGTSSGGGFFSGLSLNTNNKYQISLLLGNQVMFDQNLTYLTPKYSNNAADAIGLPGPKNSQSYSPLTYIRFNDLGSGDLVNMAGVQFTYFLTDAIDINASFGMDLRSTPKKDFIEGEQIKDMAVQGQKWIEGQFQNNWLLTLGGNYHFTVSNEKIDMYAGLQFGYQHGHINTYTPYTDEDYAFLTSQSTEALNVAAEAAAKKLAEEQSKAAILEVAKSIAFDNYKTASINYSTNVDNYKKQIANAIVTLDNAKEALKALDKSDPNYAAAEQKVTNAETTLNSWNNKLDNLTKSRDNALKDYDKANSDYIDAQGKLVSAQSEAVAAKTQANNGGNASVLYNPRVGGGQVTCFTTSVMAGVNYALSDGLILGLEFSPYTFNYTLLEVCPQGNRVYQASAFANRFFANTMLKIGFRF